MDDLGGSKSIVLNAGDLSTSTLTSELVRIITDVYESLPSVEQETLDDFLVQIIENLSDEFCAKEIVDLIDCFYAPGDIEDRFFKSFLKVAMDADKPVMTRAFALDGSLRLAFKKQTRRYLLFATLLEIEATEPPIFLKNSAKILGVANSHWPTEDALSVLHKFMGVDEAKSESAYEIGMAHLHKGFETQNKSSATQDFSTALLWFRESIKNTEQRIDAEMYELCLSILVDYSHGSLEKDKLADVADRLQKAIFLYEAWVDGEGLPSWLGARRIELANWVLLAKSLEGLAGVLEEPSWFEAKVVIENHLLTTYTASRSYLQRTKKGGIEAIIQPRIVAALVKEQGQLHHLRQWLEHVDLPEWKETTDELLAKVEKELAGQPANPTAATPCAHRGVAFLQNNSAHTPLSEAYSQVVALNAENTSPALEDMLNTCDTRLKSNPDYRNNQIRSFFLPVLTLTLRFLESRMDHTKGHHKAVGYLYQTNPLPKEDALQRDYFDFMYGQLMVTAVEVSNIGGGRADVLFQHKGSRIISELKKEEKYCSFENLKKEYAAQSSEYQNTNVRLGILLVLDLTGKEDGAGHISNQVKVVDIVRKGEESPRNLVIVKVPGRRRTPSQL